MKTLLSLLLVPILFVGLAYGVDIRVPEDFAQIQSAIEATEDGDRVLIADGTYRDRLDFLGKAITVCGNLENPERVVIKPDTAGSVVVFNNGEGLESILCGVTVQDGYTDYGGGIYINEASPSLHHLIVQNNRVTKSGGGIYITTESFPKLDNITISKNRAEGRSGGGGGMVCYRYSHSTATNIVISDCIAVGFGGAIQVSYNSRLDMSNFNLHHNSGYTMGSGVFCNETSEVNLQDGFIQYHPRNAININDGKAKITRTLISGNGDGIGYTISKASGGELEMSSVTIAQNHSDTIFFVQGGALTITNSIIWGNKGVPWYGTLFQGAGNFRVFYSTVEDLDHWLAPQLHRGAGVITENPQFLDSENGDFYLLPDSPCIDSGDPAFPLDPDSSRSDMGCFPFDPLILNGETSTTLPTEFSITSLHPNPFNARLNIAYALPMAGDVTVTLYDLNGREVHRQQLSTVPVGNHSLTMDCSTFPTGLYMVRVATVHGTVTKKALLLK